MICSVSFGNFSFFSCARVCRFVNVGACACVGGGDGRGCVVCFGADCQLLSANIQKEQMGLARSRVKVATGTSDNSGFFKSKRRFKLGETRVVGYPIGFDPKCKTNMQFWVSGYT